MADGTYPYDPDFRAAIDAGYLTVESAIHRGDRAVYVAKLVERFELPEELACQVADNRLALNHALSRLEREVGRIHARQQVRRRFLVLSAVALPVLGLLLAHSLTRLGEHNRLGEATLARSSETLPTIAPVAASVVDPYEIERDELARPTLVRGPDPTSTVERYADAWGLEFEHFEAATATDGRLRRARLIDRSNGEPLVVTVRREFSTGRWVIEQAL